MQNTINIDNKSISNSSAGYVTYTQKPCNVDFLRMFWMRSIFASLCISSALAPAAAASPPAPLSGPVGLGGGLVEAAALMIRALW